MKSAATIEGMPLRISTDEAHATSDLGAPAVLDQENCAHNSQRDRNRSADQGHFHSTDDGVVGAATFSARGNAALTL